MRNASAIPRVSWPVDVFAELAVELIEAEPAQRPKPRYNELPPIFGRWFANDPGNDRRQRNLLIAEWAALIASGVEASAKVNARRLARRLPGDSEVRLPLAAALIDLVSLRLKAACRAVCSEVLPATPAARRLMLSQPELRTYVLDQLTLRFTAEAHRASRTVLIRFGFPRAPARANEAILPARSHFIKLSPRVPARAYAVA